MSFRIFSPDIAALTYLIVHLCDGLVGQEIDNGWRKNIHHWSHMQQKHGIMNGWIQIVFDCPIHCSLRMGRSINSNDNGLSFVFHFRLWRKMNFLWETISQLLENRINWVLLVVLLFSINVLLSSKRRYKMPVAKHPGKI